MKHSFTRVLLAAFGWFVQVPVAPAQSRLAAPTGQVPAPTSILPYVQAMPPGVSALHQSLGTTDAVGRSIQATRLRKRPQTALTGQLAAPLRSNQEPALAYEEVTAGGTFHYQGPGSRSDVSTGLTVDAAGNFYVIGYGTRAEPAPGTDFITIKYSSSGQRLWVARYNVAPRSGSNRPTDVTVDAAGNVYVTGFTFTGSATTSDYATLKYSASGQQLWVATYSGPDDSDDRTGEVVIDGAGNVYVEGTTTVKYSPSGQQLWTAASANIVLDAADNVYMSRSSGITKYTATGQQIWNTPGQGGSIYLDAAGQVYVVGGVDRGTSNADYVARKYDGVTGQQLWEARYNSSYNGRDDMVSAAVDAAGNVYITGNIYRSNSNFSDYATVKFSTTGQQLWEAIYNSVSTIPSFPDYSQDVVRRLALDAAGNVYVTGNTQSMLSLPTDFLTVKYAGASGQQVWNLRYNTFTIRDERDEVIDLAVDATGNVYVAGNSFYSGSFTTSFTTVKYAQTRQQQLWEARFAGPASSTEGAEDVVADAAGNVYVTGYAYNGRNYDYATVKYTASGQQLWAARYNGPTDGEDLPTNVVVDSAGNVYVSGTSYSLTKSEYATIKYSPTGQQLWEARYSGPINGYNLAAKVALDGRGAVYVTGSSDNGSSSSYDYATLKYDAASGQQRWEARYNGPANGFDQAADLIVDRAGNVYVTGTTYSSNGSDYATLKYAGATGQQEWEEWYNGSGNGYDEATKIALVDQFSSVAVTGTSYGGTSTGYDFATIRYQTLSGFQAWESRYNDPDNGDDVVADLVVTSQGDVVVAGTSYGGRSADYSTVRYSGNGQQLWAARYDGPANSYDEATALALDAAGNSYVTGLSYNTNGTSDFATVRYAPGPSLNTGRLLWAVRYNGSGNSYDEPAAIAVDRSNNIHVTGFSLGSNTGYDFATLTYGSVGLLARPLASVPVARAGIPLAVAWAASSKSVQDLSVYPNPTVGQASVSFRPVQDGAAQVLVYNQLGRQVASLYQGTVHKGQRYTLALDGQQLAPGLYTCSLLVDGKRETVRLVVSH